ncbi:MAG TPA: M1 family aminopeptidase [Candidatus Polarisedimenticolaceae bacterium]|nr:M1 family aminopeptidase [Candidatus Polarisedimenticolaceae bacterium]
MIRCLVGALALASSCAALQSARAVEPPATVAPSLTSLLNECADPQLGAEAIPIRGATIAVGNFEMSLTDGWLVPVMGGSRVLGAYFEGHGRYLYDVREPADQEALALNLARMTNSLRVTASKVGDELTRALVLTSDPSLLGLDAGQGGDHSWPRSMDDGFRTMLTRARATATSSGEFDFRLASALLNGGRRWTYVELSGGRLPVGYVYDDALEGLERLLGFRKLVRYDVRFAQTLSEHGLPGWDAGRRLNVVLRHADISLVTIDNRSATIDSDVTLRIPEARTRVIDMMLMNNRDPDSANWSSTRQQLRVMHVRDADGRDLPFSHKYHELIVEIPTTSTADSELHLRFETEGEILLDAAGRHTDDYFSILNYPWYPSPGSPAGQQFTYTLKVKVKKPWEPVTSGREVARMDDGTFVTVQSRSDQPSMLVGVMAGKFFSSSVTTGRTTVRVHSYAWDRKDVLEKLPKLAGAMLDLYTKLLGPLQSDEIDIVEYPGRVPRPAAGLVVIDPMAFSNVHTSAASGVNARLARALAFQWFSQKAMPMNPEDLWLANSFADYYAGLALSALDVHHAGTVYGFDDLLTAWRVEAKTCADSGTIATAFYLGGEDGARDRACLLDSRGPLVLHMLRTMIGNQKFFDATRKYLDAANYGPGTTDGFTDALSRVAGEDMRWYVDQWVRRRGDAQVTFEHHVDTGPHGYRLWGTIRQAPGAGFKKLLLPVVWNDGGSEVGNVVLVDEPEEKFEFTLGAKPASVQPDPHHTNLAVYK